MKRYLLFLCGLLLAACSSEFEEEAGAVRGGRAVELTGVSGSSTRTSAGAVDGAAIPFLWSADDRIWVNGLQSSEAGTAGAAASFGFSELTGEAPYEVYYNMTGEGARAVVPSRQNQAAAGELQLGANGDFGYATTDAGGHFTLSHATSYIWFDPWSQEVDARLVSVSLATADRTIALCGTRTFDGGGFGAATGGEYAVTLSFGAEGVALPASGGDTRVFAAAVVYPVDCSATEVHVTYTFADGSVYTETRPGRKLEAGATYRLTSEITKRAGGALEIEAGEADGEPLFSQDYYVLDFTHPEGTFVLMEGNMTTENGSIVYFDQHMRCHERVYEEVNDNEIGNVLQDMYMIGGRIYFITQNGRTSSTGTTFDGDGRFVICDAHTMKRILARDMPFYAQVASSSGVKPTLCWPQHIVAVSPEKGYIQYSTSDMESHSGIRTVNLVSGVIATTDIPDTYGAFTKTGATKARMTVSRGKVFAGRGNSVIVIDSATDRVVREHTYPDRQVKDLAKGADGKIYAVFTGEFEIDGDLGYYGNVVWKSPAMIVAFDAEGEVVSEQTLPETVKLRTGTASPNVQLCASFRQPWLYFIGKSDFSATEAMRYNYETGQVDWDYITADIDGNHEGGSLIYGYMGVHPTTEQLWVGKSSYTNSRIHLYDVSRSDAVEYGSYYQKKASPAGVDFAYRFTEEWINR